MPLYEYYCEPCNGVFETIRPMREASEAGARTEVAGFETHDAPALAAAAHAFVRLAEEEPAGR